MGAFVFLILASATQSMAQVPAAEDVTFAKHVAPIMNENCVLCHQPGAIGPMSFRTYEEVRPWARLIKQRVTAGTMPPYRYDRDVGIQELKHDLRMSNEEIDTIARWVDAGAPLGDVNDLPAAPEFPDPNRWSFEDEFGAPDLVIASDPYDLPAAGGDRWFRPIVPTGLLVNRCIKAIAVKPSEKGRPGAHHANSDILVPDPETGKYKQLERVSEYASGKVGEIVPPDSCRTLPAESLIRWDIHYYPFGEAVPGDQVELGFWLYPEGHEGKYVQNLKSYSLLMKGRDMVIAPNGKAMTQGFHTFDHPVRIDSFQPHGHARLVGKTFEIFYPETGQLQMISSISNWTNNWHTSHIYEDDAAPLVPTGAVLVLTGYYDNTADNPGNPDPGVWVDLGSRTTDEMSHAWIAVTHLDQEGYDRLVAEREAKKAMQTQQQQQQ
jgi:hypothetical protein